MARSEPAGTPFQIPGAEDELIRGDVHLPREKGQGANGRLPVVLVLHGFKGYKDYGFFPFLTQALADAGFAAVRFNFSHSGIDDDPSTFGRPDLFERDSWSKQLFDVQAAIAAVEAGRLPQAERMDASRLALVGHSRGGVAALLTAADDARIGAVVSLSAPSTADYMPESQKREIRAKGFVLSPSSRTGQQLRIGRAWLEDLERNADRLNVSAAVRRIRAPLMVVHGTADASVPAGCAGDIAEAYSGEAARLVLDGVNHTFNCANPMAAPSAALRQLIAAVSAFLVERLRPESE